MDPILSESFKLLVDWFAAGKSQERYWNETPEVFSVFTELKDLHHWWHVARPGRRPAQNKDEMVAYHRIDTDQLIRLLKVREFLVHPMQAPIYPQSVRGEMDFLQFRTDDMASEVCRRGTVCGAVVVAQDDTTGPNKYDVTFYAHSDTPINLVMAVNQLLRHVTEKAEEAGCSSQKINRALGIPDEEEDHDRGF